MSTILFLFEHGTHLSSDEHVPPSFTRQQHFNQIERVRPTNSFCRFLVHSTFDRQRLHQLRQLARDLAKKCNPEVRSRVYLDMTSSSSCSSALNGRLFQPNSLGRAEIINALKLRLPCNHSFDNFKWAELVSLYRNHVIPKEQRIYNAQTTRGKKLSESQSAHAKIESTASSLKRKMDTTTGLPYDVCNKRIKLTSPAKVQSLSSPVKTTSYESESKRDEIPAEMPVESISTGNKRINLSSSSPARVQSHLLSPVSSQTTDKETGVSKTRITWP